MRVLSIDVGIKNLAFCLLEKEDFNSSSTSSSSSSSISSSSNNCSINTPNSYGNSNYKILKWDSINVADKETYNCCANEKGKKCDKPAKFFKDTCYYCLKHSKKQNLQIPTSELTNKNINKLSFQKLLELADKYGVKYEKPIKKPELIGFLNEYIYTNYFEPITTANASKTDLLTIGKNIKIRFNEIFKEDDIDIIIIENQISPIANRMKTIQGMIAQYFIMQKTEQQIEFISASNKLKAGLAPSTSENKAKSQEKSQEKMQEKTQEKTKYSDRKKLGVEKCLELLNNEANYAPWLEYFKKHGKKDDLADSLLQGLWYVTTLKM